MNEIISKIVEESKELLLPLAIALQRKSDSLTQEILNSHFPKEIVSTAQFITQKRHHDEGGYFQI